MDFLSIDFSNAYSSFFSIVGKTKRDRRMKIVLKECRSLAIEVDFLGVRNNIGTCMMFFLGYEQSIYRWASHNVQLFKYGKK